MNIKSAVSQIIPLSVRKLQRENKTEATADRDPNAGRQEKKEERTPRRNLSQEEIDKAVDYLKNLPGVKESHLSVRLTRENNVPVVFIEDPAGKIIRRIPEMELSLIGGTPATTKGNLLNKSL